MWWCLQAPTELTSWTRLPPRTLSIIFEVIICASLYQAILRPGRFDRQIHVGLPDIKGRKDIFMVCILTAFLLFSSCQESVSTLGPFEAPHDLWRPRKFRFSPRCPHAWCVLVCGLPSMSVCICMCECVAVVFTRSLIAFRFCRCRDCKRVQ